MKNILIHVGYPKTATTYLQDNFFSKHIEISFLGCSRYSDLPLNKIEKIKTGNNIRWKYIPQIHLSDGLNFDINKIVKSTAAKMSKQKKYVISEEAYLDDILNNRYKSKIVADRLKKIFPDAKILITIRGQSSMINSEYCEYIKGGGRYPIKDLLNWDETAVGKKESFILSHLKYDKVVSYYHFLFGKDNVLVLPLELLNRNKKEFFKLLCDFFSLSLWYPQQEVKKSINKSFCFWSTLYIFRFLNKIFKSSNNRYNLLPDLKLQNLLLKVDQSMFKLFPKSNLKQSKKKWINKSDILKINNYYSESNIKLDQLIDLDLKKHGYL